MGVALTPIAVVPEPRSREVVCVAPLSVLLVPYKNHVWVSVPLGFTLPFKVAEFVVIEPAEPVVAAGACAEAVVVKLLMVPLVVPELFWATTLK